MSAALFSMAACKKEVSKKNDNSIKTGNVQEVKGEQKFTVDEVETERKKFFEWLDKQEDCKIFQKLYASTTAIFPLLYSDKRLKLNFFISKDHSFGDLSQEIRKKLDDPMIDDYELKLINSGIVKSIDFGWSATQNLSGKRLEFSKDGKTVQLGEKICTIEDVVSISPHTRVYVIKGVLE